LTQPAQFGILKFKRFTHN